MDDNEEILNLLMVGMEASLRTEVGLKGHAISVGSS